MRFFEEEEIFDRHIGKKGSSERCKFEKKLYKELMLRRSVFKQFKGDLRVEFKTLSYSTGDEHVNTSLLWEYDLKGFDWDNMKPLVIQRVIERGCLSDFYAIIQLYGYQGVKDTITSEIKCFYNDFDLYSACYLFDIEITETKAYYFKEDRYKRLSI